MSSPAAAPPHASEKQGSGRPLAGLAGIIAFIFVATVLVVGPKFWTVGEVLGTLARSLGATRPLEVAPSGPAPVVEPTAAVSLPAPLATVPQPRPAGSSMVEKPHSAPASRAPLRPARSSAAPKTVAKPAPVKATPAPVKATPAPSPPASNRLQHFYALMDEGIRLYRAGWFGPSAGRFRRAVAVMPDSPYAHLWLGRASLAAQRPDDARRALQRVIVLAPDSQAAREAAVLLKQLAAAGI